MADGFREKDLYVGIALDLKNLGLCTDETGKRLFFEENM